MFAALTRTTSGWLFRLRASEPGEVVLHRRRVLILPTKAGIGFAGLLLVLLIGATSTSDWACADPTA
jgi:hypothetical protein